MFIIISHITKWYLHASVEQLTEYMYLYVYCTGTSSWLRCAFGKGDRQKTNILKMLFCLLEKTKKKSQNKMFMNIGRQMTEDRMDNLKGVKFKHLTILGHRVTTTDRQTHKMIVSDIQIMSIRVCTITHCIVYQHACLGLSILPSSLVLSVHSFLHSLYTHVWRIHACYFFTRQCRNSFG